MKLENQVLSVNQVQKLIELGFDVSKHASMCWYNYGIKGEPSYTLNSDIQVINNYRSIPTLTIGDIIKILPKEIEEKVLNIFAFGETWSVGWEGIQYCGSNTLIDALFEALKWCIKEKHLAL